MVAKTSFPIGRGLAYEAKHPGGRLVRGYMAPFGRGVVRLKVSGPAEWLKKIDSEIKAACGSLRKLPS